MLGLGRVARVGDDDEDSDSETDRLLGSGPEQGGDSLDEPLQTPGELLFGKGSDEHGGGNGGDDNGGGPSWHPEKLADDYGYKMLDDCISATAGRFQVGLACLCALANFVDAAETMMLGLLYPTLAKYFNLNESELALIATLTNTGMLVGAVTFGRLSDSYGRKLTFSISMCLVFIFGLASSFAQDLVTFAVLRMFLGLGYGGNLVTGTTLLVEFVSHEKRGMWVILTGVGFGVGALAIAGISWAVIPHLGWQWLIRIAAFMALPALALLYFVPESPRFYIMIRDFDKCVESMEYVAKVNKKRLPSAFNATTLNVVHHHDESKDNSWRNLYGAQKICRRTILITLAPLALCWFLNAFANVINNWLPIHSQRRWPEREDVVYEIALVQSAGLLVGTLMQLSLVYYLPRLVQLRTGFLVSGIFVLLLGFFGLTSFAAMASIAFFIQIAEQFVIGTLYLYTPEAFPTNIRVTAFGICQANHRFAPIVAPNVVAALDSISFNVTSFVFSSLFFLGFLCSMLVRVRTFNRPLVEHSDLFESEPPTKGGGKEDMKHL